jgi:adenine/guanine phosphoribosyltransferase-like PRPP-binding protein
VISSLPSSGARAGEHTLATAIKMVPELRDQYRPLLSKSSVAITHNVASDTGFALREPLNGERVLPIDDTFTSGSRAQGAASAINNDGGTVAAIVTVGGVINPAFSETVKEYWDRRRRRRFSFDTCCLE